MEPITIDINSVIRRKIILHALFKSGVVFGEKEDGTIHTAGACISETPKGFEFELHNADEFGCPTDIVGYGIVNDFEDLNTIISHSRKVEFGEQGQEEQ